jgi:hypothetical protein
MEFLIKYGFIIAIVIYYIYTGIKNMQKVNADRPQIPANQPDIKPEKIKRAEVDRRHPTAMPFPNATRTAPTQKPAQKPQKTFEEAMAEMFSDTKGEGYGSAKPFSYNAEEAQPIAEPAKDYKFGDNLVGDIKDRKPKSVGLRGEIGSEDESPTRRKMSFRPKNAIKYSILMERKYFEV